MDTITIILAIFVAVALVPAGYLVVGIFSAFWAVDQQKAVAPIQ